MKPFLLYRIVGLLMGLQMVLSVPSIGTAATARDADVPVITTLLDQRDGSSVKISFRAIHWNPDMMNSVKIQKEMRDYFNQYLAPKMGILETNITLKFGPRLQIDPGVYYIGVRVNEPMAAGENPTWSLIISNDQKPLITLPVILVQENIMQDYLSFVFTPGITDRDFMFHMMYGDLSTAIRWTILGIPSMTAHSNPGTISAWDLPQPGTEGIPLPGAVGNNAVNSGEIPSSTSPIPPNIQNQPKIQKKAGSGSLRYLNEIKKKNDDQSANANEKDTKKN